MRALDWIGMMFFLKRQTKMLLKFASLQVCTEAKNISLDGANVITFSEKRTCRDLHLI